MLELHSSTNDLCDFFVELDHSFGYWKNRSFFFFLFTMQWLQMWHVLSFICILNIFSITFLDLDQGSANYNPRTTLNLVHITLLNYLFHSKYHNALIGTKIYEWALFSSQMLYIISFFLELLFSFHFFHIIFPSAISLCFNIFIDYPIIFLATKIIYKLKFNLS